MMDLAAKDSYMQKFAKKVFFQQEQEPKKRPFGNVLPYLQNNVDIILAYKLTVFIMGGL